MMKMWVCGLERNCQDWPESIGREEVRGGVPKCHPARLKAPDIIAKRIWSTVSGVST